MPAPQSLLPMIGQTISHYRILEKLGGGGMGVVYKAEDTRLRRFVALKFLPSEVARDAQALARFRREAQAASALNHPNICHLYDVGEQDGTSYLAMEYLEGETLADRLRKGPLPLEQLLKVGTEICDGLEKAHRSGVVHRDLKPSNIMLTKSGAKLLDFGLAKTMVAVMGAGRSAESTATISAPVTTEGTIVGTFQYMSPEQLRGREADPRSDIFSFGAVLYEMATAKRAFEGKSNFSVASAILEKEPEPLTAIQPKAPPALDHVVRGCLAQDPDSRWQSAGDIARELRWISTSSRYVSPLPAAGPARKNWYGLGGLALGIMLGASTAWLIVTLSQSPQTPFPVRSYISAPENTSFAFVGLGAGPVALSPDGRNLAFVAVAKGTAPQIYMRQLDSLEAHPLAGTENAWAPFWSPDGRSVGYFADGKLKTMDIRTGLTNSICAAPNGRGGSWNKNGAIIFTPDVRDSIYQVPASGGTPQPVTKLDLSKHTSHRWPFFLPDGKHFLYLAVNSQSEEDENNGLYYASLDGKENHLLVTSSRNAQYASGYLLLVRNGQLMAQRFDPQTGALQNDPQSLATSITEDSGRWRAVFSVSTNGVLAYSGGAQSQSQLAWFDRSGHQLVTVGEKFTFYGSGVSSQLRLSPRGDQATVSILQGGASDIWVIDIARGVRSRFTFGPGVNELGIWSPDGKWIAYRSVAKDGNSIKRRPAAGGNEEVLLSSSEGIRPTDWSPDGKYLAYARLHSGAITEIGALPLTGKREPFRVVSTDTGFIDNPRISPDGHWIAYSSTASARPEIYVVSFPNGSGKWQVSAGGGTGPSWRRDGKEIFYLSPADVLTSVPVSQDGGSLQFGAPTPLFPILGRDYDVTADGQKFLIGVAGNVGTRPITLVTDWTAGLRR